MAQQSPSKYLSLKFLKKVQADYYRSETGIEYWPDEVDQLIADKEDRLSAAMANDWEDSYAELQAGFDCEPELTDFAFMADQEDETISEEALAIGRAVSLGTIIRECKVWLNTLSTKVVKGPWLNQVEGLAHALVGGRLSQSPPDWWSILKR